MNLFCSAGEASGDALLAGVLQHLLPVNAFGLGGMASQNAGLSCAVRAADVTASGGIEALRSVPKVISAFFKLKQLLTVSDAALLVDFPELNLRLLQIAAQNEIPAFYLAPPQVWAWRSSRVHLLKAAKRVFCLFPFELPVLTQAGVSAEFVGHPLAQLAPCTAKSGFGVALLPGSRPATVSRLLPKILKGAALLKRASCSQISFHLAVASTLNRTFLQRFFEDSELEVEFHESAQAALSQSRVAIVGAGTASLEAALAGVPPVTLCALHPLSFAVARRLVRIEHAALPNLVLNRRAYPELWQNEITASAIADAVAEQFSRNSSELRDELAFKLQGSGLQTVANALKEIESQVETRL